MIVLRRSCAVYGTLNSNHSLSHGKVLVTAPRYVRLLINLQICRWPYRCHISINERPVEALNPLNPYNSPPLQSNTHNDHNPNLYCTGRVDLSLLRGQDLCYSISATRPCEPSTECSVVTSWRLHGMAGVACRRSASSANTAGTRAAGPVSG